jgi:PAS domain S-box-containing protein
MEKAALLKAIIETAIDGIITIDERGNVESINPSACNLFQYSPAEVIGKNVSMLMPSPYRENHDGYIARDGRHIKPKSWDNLNQKDFCTIWWYFAKSFLDTSTAFPFTTSG